MFTKDELLVLEYSNDLGSFTNYGPAPGKIHEINRYVQCPSVRDMVQRLSSPGGPLVTTYFTHSPAMLLHLTAMGAYAKGPVLTPNSIPAKREWKSGELSPMAANLAAIRYKDDTVRFILNDKMIVLPGCPKGVCKLSQLQTLFGRCL